MRPVLRRSSWVLRAHGPEAEAALGVLAEDRDVLVEAPCEALAHREVLETLQEGWGLVSVQLVVVSRPFWARGEAA